MDISAYSGARVLVTGHTGFKGSWLCEWLLASGAEVHGFALPPTRPALFNMLRLSRRIASHTLGDVRDLAALEKTVRRIMPDFVFHLAAQPIVMRSYEDPVETFGTNAMGTVHLLEAVRRAFRNGGKCSVVCITSDKCYENRETRRPYRETDPMGGYDPYSCSKGCSELIVSSYRRSFHGSPDSPVWIASARAGNVIGGGDWAKDRIVPDCMRAIAKGTEIRVRNRSATRPWQHVLEPLGGYLALGAALAERKRFADVCGGFNFGPDPKSNRTVGDLVSEIARLTGAKWCDAPVPGAAHEAGLLNLDIAKARRILGWRPAWDFRETARKTAEWYESVRKGASALETTQGQIAAYCGECS